MTTHKAYFTLLGTGIRLAKEATYPDSTTGTITLGNLACIGVEIGKSADSGAGKTGFSPISRQLLFTYGLMVSLWSIIDRSD